MTVTHPLHSDATNAGYDPGAHGWEIDVTTPFTMYVGPIWRRYDASGFANGFLTDERHAGPHGYVDRGVILAFADHAIGISGAHKFPEVSQVTLQLNTTFSGEVKVGEFIEGRSEVLRAESNFIFVRGLLHVGATPIASCEGIWKIVKSLR